MDLASTTLTIPLSTMTGFKTVTFAKHEGVDIKLDYMLPAAATPGSKVPILLWFHGGGLLMGTRTCAWSHLVNAVEKHNLCLVTADYRLAPQTRMPGIMLDVKAVMDYLNSPDFLVETGGVVDQQKIIVSGGSAGGWLALLIATGVGFEACGLYAPPKPLAVAPLYPITDIEAHFFTSKQYPVSYVKEMIPESAVAPFLDPNAPQSSECALTSPRMKMYPYMVGVMYRMLLTNPGTGGDRAATSSRRHQHSRQRIQHCSCSCCRPVLNATHVHCARNVSWLRCKVQLAC